MYIKLFFTLDYYWEIHVKNNTLYLKTFLIRKFKFKLLFVTFF